MLMFRISISSWLPVFLCRSARSCTYSLCEFDFEFAFVSVRALHRSLSCQLLAGGSILKYCSPSVGLECKRARQGICLCVCVSRSMAWRSISLPVLFILARQQNFALWSARPLLRNGVWPCHRSKSLSVCPLAFDFQMHQSKLNVLQAHWPLLWIIVIPICARRRYHAILSSPRNLVRDAFTS